MKTVLFLFLLLLLAGCSDQSDKPESAAYSMISMPAVEHKEVQQNMAVDQSSFFIPPKMIIKNADLQIVVDDYEETTKKVEKIVKDYKGYINESNMYAQVNNAQGGTIRIKVPSDKLEKVISGLKGVAERIKSESVNASDVTEEYIDINARLINKKALEERYREILKTAKSTRDVLDVEEKLFLVRGEIESVEKRIQYLEYSTIMSGINLTIEEKGVETAGEPGLLDNIILGFLNGIKGFFIVSGTAITILISLIPLTPVIYLLYIIIIKLVKKWRIKKTAFARTA